MRSPFLRTTNEPNEDSFTVSPRSMLKHVPPAAGQRHIVHIPQPIVYSAQFPWSLPEGMHSSRPQDDARSGC